MTNTERNINIESAQQALISLWLDAVDQQSLIPIANKNRAASLLQQAKITGQTVAFVAIGCADWVDWSTTDEKIWHVGKLDQHNKRATRFVNEVSSFQTALASFGIDSLINLSLSNVEMHDPNRDPKLDGRFDDQVQAQANIDFSNHSIAAMLSSAGVKFQLFNHWNFILQLGFEAAFSAPPNTFFEYINRLYSFDLANTAPALTNFNQLGPIWLDIQSFSFPEFVSALRQKAQVVAPQLPILAPFKNSGNWHAKPEPENHFPDVFEFMQTEFKFKSSTSIIEWQQKALKLPDETILAALKALEITNITIDDNWEKRKNAVDILASIAFNY